MPCLSPEARPGGLGQGRGCTLHLPLCGTEQRPAPRPRNRRGGEHRPGSGPGIRGFERRGFQNGPGTGTRVHCTAAFPGSGMWGAGTRVHTHTHAHMEFGGGGTAVLALGATPAASPSLCTAMNVNTGLVGPPRGPAVRVHCVKPGLRVADLETPLGINELGTETWAFSSRAAFWGLLPAPSAPRPPPNRHQCQTPPCWAPVRTPPRPDGGCPAAQKQGTVHSRALPPTDPGLKFTESVRQDRAAAEGARPGVVTCGHPRRLLPRPRRLPPGRAHGCRPPLAPRP